MAEGRHETMRGEPWTPQSRAEHDEDVLLSARDDQGVRRTGAVPGPVRPHTKQPRRPHGRSGGPAVPGHPGPVRPHAKQPRPSHGRGGEAAPPGQPGPSDGRGGEAAPLAHPGPARQPEQPGPSHGRGGEAAPPGHPRPSHGRSGEAAPPAHPGPARQPGHPGPSHGRSGEAAPPGHPGPSHGRGGEAAPPAHPGPARQPGHPGPSHGRSGEAAPPGGHPGSVRPSARQPEQPRPSHGRGGEAAPPAHSGAVRPPARQPEQPPQAPPSHGPVADRVRRLPHLIRAARRLGWVTVLLSLTATGLGVYGITGLVGGSSACVPPLELRVLTDPDLEATVGAAADAYLTSDANTTGDGCRRSGITVYSAGSADAVTALRRESGAWHEPRDEDLNPQRDIGPQPDIWIPGSPADVARVTTGQDTDALARLEPDDRALAYSPIVLAVPTRLAATSLDERVGGPLTGMLDGLRERHEDAEVRRPDPEFADAALLATIGLYGTGTDPGRVEQRLVPPGPPSPTAADLLCALPDDDAVDHRTAALVPEFLLKSGVGCDRTTRSPRTAQYPGDVPGLEPVFVRVRWAGADRDRAARDEAAEGFRAWLAGAGGRAAFGAAGFRAADGDRALLDPGEVADGVLPAPSLLIESAGRDAMDTALRKYRDARGPGRVLFLLDSSGSMAGRWRGPSGGPGLLKQSLGGLGGRDEYGVWAVADSAGNRSYETLLPFGPHSRRSAEAAIDAGARVRDAEADPYAALVAALDDMAERGADDDRPQLIVLVTDDEDAGRLTGPRLEDVLSRARLTNVPITMVSLESGGCAAGRPDALISAASGGRCLDADDELGTGLSAEVARTGTGEQ
ncbi:substrate-binding domain-containing protein [Streptomyces spinoverrucosus]|nr:substrate-binding domain-containing protein [Streptomyces spinoverrucosus]